MKKERTSPSCLLHGRRQRAPGHPGCSSKTGSNYNVPERAALPCHAGSRTTGFRQPRLPDAPAFDGGQGTVQKVIYDAQADGHNVLGLEARRCWEPMASTLKYRIVNGLDRGRGCRTGDRLPGGHEDRLPGHPPQVRRWRRQVGVGDDTRCVDAYNKMMNDRPHGTCPTADICGVLDPADGHRRQRGHPGHEPGPAVRPVLMFGLGGIYVEVLKDVQFRVAPLTREGRRWG